MLEEEVNKSRPTFELELGYYYMEGYSPEFPLTKSFEAKELFSYND